MILRVQGFKGSRIRVKETKIEYRYRLHDSQFSVDSQLVWCLFSDVFINALIISLEPLNPRPLESFALFDIRT